MLVSKKAKKKRPSSASRAFSSIINNCLFHDPENHPEYDEPPEGQKNIGYGGYQKRIVDEPNKRTCQPNGYGKRQSRVVMGLICVVICFPRWCFF